MIYQEIHWIRSNLDKLSPSLRKLALEWYRPFRHIPCFLQKYFKGVRKKIRRYRVIVQYESDMDQNYSMASAAKGAKCRLEKELPLINGFTTKVNAKALEKLVMDQKVKKIWFDEPVKAILDTAAPAVKASQVWDLGVTGKGVGIAIIDTGIYDHPDLAGRIRGFTDFVNGKETPYDDNGHGTHIAGDAAADGIQSKAPYRGTAHGADLIGVKVLDSMGSGFLSTVIQGIDWCIKHQEEYGIRVINLSLGSSASQSYAEDPVCQAVEKAWEQGIVVCAAAGNEGPDQKTIASPGIDPMILTIGSVDDHNSTAFSDFTIAPYSSRGPTIDNFMKPDVVAPGTAVISLRSPGSTLDKQNKSARVGSNYLSLSGTSMATPVCSGVVALLLEKFPDLSPYQVKQLLMNHAAPLSGVLQTDQGKGLIDATAAYNANQK